ncbi:uncharacterized protein RBU33_028589 isoform 1-T1 [Hipposideros larvatus]
MTDTKLLRHSLNAAASLKPQQRRVLGVPDSGYDTGRTEAPRLRLGVRLRAGLESAPVTYTPKSGPRPAATRSPAPAAVQPPASPLARTPLNCEHLHHVRITSLWPSGEGIHSLCEPTCCGTEMVYTESLLNSEKVASWNQPSLTFLTAVPVPGMGTGFKPAQFLLLIVGASARGRILFSIEGKLGIC